MSRTKRRNIYAACVRIYEEGGRIPIIRKDPDREVSHSHACTACERGSEVKRLFHIKPRRRREHRELARIIRDET